MKIRIAFALALLAGLSTFAQTEKPSLTGTWNMALQGDHVIPAAMELTQNGTKVTGLWLFMSKEVPLTGEVVDGAFTLNGKGKLSAPGHEPDPSAPDLKITGKIEEDGSLSGVLPGPHGEFKWTAERFKTRKVAAKTAGPIGGIDGTWNISAQTDHVVQVGMVLKQQEGAKVTGTLMMPGTDVPLEGEFADGKLSLTGKAPAGATGHAAEMGSMKLTATLTPEGSLAGEFASQRGAMRWTAERLRGK